MPCSLPSHIACYVTNLPTIFRNFCDSTEIARDAVNNWANKPSRYLIWFPVVCKHKYILCPCKVCCPEYRSAAAAFFLKTITVLTRTWFIAIWSFSMTSRLRTNACVMARMNIFSWCPWQPRFNNRWPRDCDLHAENFTKFKIQEISFCNQSDDIS